MRTTHSPESEAGQDSALKATVCQRHSPNVGSQAPSQNYERSSTSPEPPHVAGATARRVHVSLATTVRSHKPPPCSSRQDEAVAADHVAIGITR
ncbi:hypothetical protein F2Q70_00020851 [Brassica cretica]|uniref:Uncharacterized protein n=1 Tax=Brassica cretica TaxID=69181 RepID=A0A8S9GV20_BRACR|nr:hypothetical protein F2Q70_00020851 [Brassica cretica]KAF2556514.1 hypothetical protein F2Q68_00014286 [Brassica cretica]